MALIRVLRNSPELAFYRMAMHFVIEGLRRHSLHCSLTGWRILRLEIQAGIEEKVLGWRAVECNVCGWRGSRSRPATSRYGHWIRYNVVCPCCSSRERHRLLAYFLQQLADVDWGAVTLLEVSPTLGRDFYRRLNMGRYLGVDLEVDGVDARMDVRYLALADGSCQVVICYHVLEHVKEDLAAIRELHRVMADDGWGIFQVPIDEDLAETIEYEAPKPEESFHVRRYGRDYCHRLRGAGFTVEVVDVCGPMPAQEPDSLGLMREEKLYLVRKRKG